MMVKHSSAVYKRQSTISLKKEASDSDVFVMKGKRKEHINYTHFFFSRYESPCVFVLFQDCQSELDTQWSTFGTTN